MKHYRYLIVGGGMAGDAAVRGIRELDAEGSIGMVSVESDPPLPMSPCSSPICSSLVMRPWGN